MINLPVGLQLKPVYWVRDAQIFSKCYNLGHYTSRFNSLFGGGRENKNLLLTGGSCWAWQLGVINAKIVVPASSGIAPVTGGYQLLRRKLSLD